MQQFRSSPYDMAENLWRHRYLIGALVRREVVGRYRGSLVGMAWSFFNPVLMLLIYTFVFSVVFKARWPIGSVENKIDFAMMLFVGMIIHGLFAECVNRAPSLIVSNPNYVKKVIFPLEILPCVALGSALFHITVSLVVLLLAQLLLHHHLIWTVILFPPVLLPLVLLTMGCAWFLAGLGVYVRDIGHFIGMGTTVLLFLSPVFYPISALPIEYQIWLYLNPLTLLIEEGRNVLILGRVPDLWAWGMMLVIGMFVSWVGFVWFQKMRRGFADVL